MRAVSIKIVDPSTQLTTTAEVILLLKHCLSQPPKKGRTAVEVGADGVAVIAINNPPLNLLSVDVLLSLKESIEGTLLRDDVRAIVITGSKGKFSAGFDVTVFGGSQGRRTRKELGFFSIEFITDILEAARKPFVAAIDGPAFGGGLEIALACHARISTSSAQLGLPELQYGILPGLGGTQRLPRLVGLPKALELILMSKRVNGEEARILSLVDVIAPSDKLLTKARQCALDILECRRPWVTSLYKTDKLAPLGQAREILKLARLQIQKQNPNLMHPLVCIDVIEHGIASGPRNGLWKEAEALQELRQSSTCRSLIHMFFAQTQMLKIPGITDINLLPRKINKVAILGGGLMASELTTVLVLSNYQVILKEKDEKCLLDDISRVKENLQNHVKKEKATQEKLEKSLNLIMGVLNYENFKDVDLVIEAESESLSLTEKKFSELKICCPPNCIFASNSSTLSLKLLGERTKCHSRMAKIQFFCPSPVLPLMEIVCTHSSPQVIVDLIAFGRKMRKTPIVVRDCNGYAVNRMIITYLHAAILLAERSVDVYKIDRAITSFGMSLGPFRMIDLVGFQVAIMISKIFVENFSERSYKPKLIQIMQQDNREGESNSKGFYIYDKNNKPSPDPEMMKYTEKARTTTIDSELTALSDHEIAEMILFPALNEACRIISEGIAFGTSDLDVASVKGMGFPAYRGGIVFWSNSLGSTYIYSRLDKWSKDYGDFFKPCAYLLERASDGASLENRVARTKSHL